ncbi:DNA topoisomerase 3 [Gemelliphila palaticanis]|uniref:DNA topoisomerase n=1 Tax=Gemelliphila palaticanis TaxID=81950 RepID=A0ABX2T0R6_9BACL|nr:DNA topoisomerase 3 [Gemella palaticanis]MBF0715846.1 DNA topoisomerase 3 [Gemella palaticanis]NYS47776.1 DNA topoisomerase 3 [Gemella palaticanis]
MKSLVICEKPSVARDIAKNIGAFQNKNGCLEGSNYVVTWALGHLITLQTPDKYKEFKNVTLESLPMIPKFMKTEIIGKTFKQYKIVENAINRKDISEIIIATDAGREGELVARYIIEKSGSKKTIKRLWISSVTDKAIKDGFKNLKPGKDYEGLYNSGLARAHADWLIGINASKALTYKYNASLNCGRVQTPTLQMVKNREDVINNFKPKDYFIYECKINNINFLSNDSDFNKENAEKFITSNKNNKVEIVAKSKDKVSSPKPLYNLTDIQQLASSMYKISPKQTLNIIQSLYERHKILTYPRTDSRYITTDMIGTLRDRLRAVSTGEYSTIVKGILSSKNFETKRIVNNSKVSDHHAIIPTEERPNYNQLSDLELKIYNLVVRRFLENLLPNNKYKETEYSFILGNKKFSNKQIINIELGYKIFEHNSLDNNLVLLDNKQYILDNLVYIKKQTSAPNYFTEGTLIYAMENPFEYVDSAEERKILKETNGIGTVATRADILEKLFSNDYLILDDNKIKTTNKAKQLLNLAPEKLKSPSMTAIWEKQLDNIAKNKIKKEQFLKDIKNYTFDLVNEIRNSEDRFKHDNISGKRCEKCNSFMLDLDKKGTKMLKCSNINCKNIKVVSKLTNLRCDTCHKKMTLFGSGENATYRCSCGNSIKQKEVDKKIKNTKKEKASYKDLKKYMSKDTLENNSLKEKLQGLKLK